MPVLQAEFVVRIENNELLAIQRPTAIIPFKAYQLVAMERITLYLKESYHELVKNVSWPTLTQLQESTIVVLVTSVILALIIFVMDMACSVVFKNLYGVWSAS
jgi:preprotein translocase subunit SecE